MAESRDSTESTNNQVKLDQVRNITGSALLRTLPTGGPTRFMMATPVQSTAALISSTTTIHTQVLPKVSGQTGSGSNVGRLSTIPIQSSTSTGYHVPRGAAAVANISVPRSSVATPIVRTPSTSATAQSPLHPSSLPLPGVGGTSCIGTTGSGRSVVGMTCLPGQQRPPPIPVGARLVSGQMRPLSGDPARPVLLHATTTHKQVTLTQQAQVQVGGGGGGGGVKSYSNPSRSVAAPPLSRLAALPSGMVSLHSATAAVLLPSQPLKATPAQPSSLHHKMLPGAGHGSQVQLPAVPGSTPGSQTIAISSVVNRPPGDVVTVVLGGTTGGGVMGTGGATTGGGGLKSPGGGGQLLVGGCRGTILVRECGAARGVAGAPGLLEGVAQATAPPTTPVVGTPPTTGSLYSLGGAGTATFLEQQAVGPALASRPGALLGLTPPPPPATPPSAPLVKPPHPMPQLTATATPQVNQASSHLPMRLNPMMLLETGRGIPLSTASASELSLTGGSEAPPPSLLPKQVTSPRPTILRKRDPDGCSPMKGQKNLTPLLSSLSSSGAVAHLAGGGGSPPPSWPPSLPPKRPDSSSGGSTTVSANSSPGDSPPCSSGLVSQQSAGDGGGGTTVAALLKEAAPQEEEPPRPPPEVSPRKKPRKQQLTGNQMTESAAFSEEEMEFISEEKMKKEHILKEEDGEDKTQPTKKSMSLMTTYRHPWKSKNNHFFRYTDVKTKEEKTPTLSELANQKNALQKLNGWKLHHLGSQMEDVVKSETEFFGLYTSLLSVLEIKQKSNKNKEVDKEISRINERVRANFQRSKVVKDQMLEAKNQMMKLFEHKTNVADIITRNMNKRNSSMKKRDRI